MTAALLPFIPGMTSRLLSLVMLTALAMADKVMSEAAFAASVDQLTTALAAEAPHIVITSAIDLTVLQTTLRHGREALLHVLPGTHSITVRAYSQL
jgi:hypothetical protein